MSNLNGKVAVVTGGNSGIGYATAQRLKEQGAHVIITGRSATKLEQAATALEVTGIVADAASVAETDKLVNEVKEKFGSVDILVVNAGVTQPAQVGSISEENFNQLMGINFKGAVFTIEKFLPILNDGAAIINISSVVAYTGVPGTALYAASKAALDAYTRTAAIELASRKIRVNAVSPGPVQTPIWSKAGIPEEMLDGYNEQMINSVPLKRLGTPEEVARLISFLVSDEATFITGSMYNIDGGVSVNTIMK